MSELSTTTLNGDGNLQGYWKLENNLTDTSSNGYNLTDSNTADTASGKYGHGRQCTLASSPYAYLASVANLRITTSQTWCCWGNLTSLGDATNHRTAMGLLDAGATHTGVLLRPSQAVSTKPRFTISTLSPAYVEAPDAVSTGVFHFFAGRWNSVTSTLSIFVDGVKTDQTGVTGSISFTGDEGFALSAAGLYTAGQYFDGVLDDCAIFNRALTDAEISLLSGYGGNSGGFFNFL
jgi:hypothetical protein